MTDLEKQKKFLELFSPLKMKLERFVRAKVRNKELAKDIIGETVMIAYASFDKLKSEKAFLSYLFTTADRLLRRKSSRESIFTELQDIHSESIPATTVNPDKQLEIEELYLALDKLPEKQKSAVILFEISGFSIEEIKAIQGGTLSGVKSRIKRGREKLKELLDDEISIKSETSDVNSCETRQVAANAYLLTIIIFLKSFFNSI